MPSGMPIRQAMTTPSAAEVDRDHRRFPEAGHHDEERVSATTSSASRQPPSCQPASAEQQHDADPGQLGQQALQRDHEVEQQEVFAPLRARRSSSVLIQSTAAFDRPAPTVTVQAVGIGPQRRPERAQRPSVADDERRAPASSRGGACHSRRRRGRPSALALRGGLAQAVERDREQRRWRGRPRAPRAELRARAAPASTS